MQQSLKIPKAVVDLSSAAKQVREKQELQGEFIRQKKIEILNGEETGGIKKRIKYE